MPARFNGQNIFGSQQQQTGPTPKMREQRETLPGVRGYRVYQLIGTGPDTRTWVIRGRYVANTLGRLQSAIADAQDRIGTFGMFQETGGGRWRDCELIDFRPASGFQTCQINGATQYTCLIVATIEQAGG